MKFIFLLVGVVLFTSCSNDNPGEQEERKTYVPDDNFEQVLIDLGFDDILDNYVLTSNIESIKALPIGHYEQPDNFRIDDLTGIEDFSALEYLDLANHNLTTVDLSKILNLWELNLINNNLSEINLNQNVKLRLLSLNGNNLSEINLRSNTQLAGISIESNNLSLIDLTQNTELQEVYLSENNLKDLDLSGFDDLFMIWAVDNQLESFNISNSSQIMEVYVINNYLNCIQVDEEQLDGGNISIFEKDEDVILSIDCNS